MNKEYDYNLLSEKEKLEMVRQNGCIIKYIDNPTEELKLEAVKEDWKISNI